MGFSTLLDILGSMIIGGVLMSIVFRLSDAATEKTYNNSGELALQQNLATVAQIIERDFRKIGYCANWNKLPDPTKAILMADTSGIKFLTDIESDGNLDSIYFYLGPASELSATENPRDRLLYRVVNDDNPQEANLGVTHFNLIYYDALGDTIYHPILNNGEISSIEINVTVENVAAYDENYSRAYWRQIRMVARNLKNR
jgi:type II secretory pathway component PulJ